MRPTMRLSRSCHAIAPRRRNTETLQRPCDDDDDGGEDEGEEEGAEVRVYKKRKRPKSSLGHPPSAPSRPRTRQHTAATRPADDSSGSPGATDGGGGVAVPVERGPSPLPVETTAGGGGDTEEAAGTATQEQEPEPEGAVATIDEGEKEDDDTPAPVLVQYTADGRFSVRASETAFWAYGSLVLFVGQTVAICYIAHDEDAQDGIDVAAADYVATQRMAPAQIEQIDADKVVVRFFVPNDKTRPHARDVCVEEEEYEQTFASVHAVLELLPETEALTLMPNYTDSLQSAYRVASQQRDRDAWGTRASLALYHATDAAWPSTLLGRAIEETFVQALTTFGHRVRLDLTTPLRATPWDKSALVSTPHAALCRADCMACGRSDYHGQTMASGEAIGSDCAHKLQSVSLMYEAVRRYRNASRPMKTTTLRQVLEGIQAKSSRARRS